MDGAGKEHYCFGEFRLDLTEGLLTRDDIPLPLPPKCFDLLALLVQNAGHLVEKDRILKTLWPDTFVEEANVPNLIGQLRKTLGDSLETPRYIQTVPKRGYRFVAPLLPPDHAACESSTGRQSRMQASIRIIAFPFRSDPAGAGTDYLAYGLPEAIGATLAELNLFTVRSTQLAMRFDPLRWDPQTVAEEADIDVILTGTLERAGERIHATTQLVDAPTGTVIWSKVWNIVAHDLSHFHSGVVQLIVRSLTRRTLENGEAATIGIDAPSSPEVYEIYLRANHLLRNRSPENFRLARDLYVACTNKDPGFAPAWARLGRCYRWQEKFDRFGNAIGNSSEQAFQRAFQLNPQLVIAHCGYTPVQCDAGYAQDAMVRLLRVLEQNQNNPEIYAALVHACRYCGLLDVSLAAHTKAVQLDRHLLTSVAHTWFAAGDYEQALYWYDTKSGFYLDALALASMGRVGEASALLWTRRERFSVHPALMNSLQAHLENDPVRGLAALRMETPVTYRDPESHFYMARQAARFGDLPLANELLSQSVEWGYCSSVCLTQDAWFSPLRATPEFEQTLSVVQTRENAARCAFVEARGAARFGISEGMQPKR
jgi:DNA-binding winged helix-turn-helix (wHTH) protein/tetratricopeptide (TPR) repeat protein